MNMMLLECCWSCKLGHKTRLFLLVVGLLLYLVIGAFVFQALEERNESDQITELRSVRAEFAAKIGVEGKLHLCLVCTEKEASSLKIPILIGPFNGL